MLQHPAAVRAAFDESTQAFVTTVRAVPDDLWDAPGALGEWTVRELTGHALRALTTVETYLAVEPAVGARTVADTGEYFHIALGDPAMHRGVAERGRQAGAGLADPPGQVEDVAQRVQALVASTGDDDPIASPAGTMVFSEYLSTRVVELAVHTLDLQRATNQVTAMSPATAQVVLGVLVQMADPVRLTLALTGRQPLPADHNVFG
jgi:uncharacterized protein (TIGR03083 family)